MHDVARKNRQAAIGTFFLHLIPGGAAADQVSQGEYGEAAISAAGDLFLVAGAATKAVKAVKAAKVVTVAGMAVEGGIAAYRGYQGIEKLTRGDTIGAAGDAGEVVLRLIGVKLSASELKAMKNVANKSIDLDAVIDEDKFNYLFGNVTSSAHNKSRSLQNASQLGRIGFHDTPEWRKHLRNYLTEVAKDPNNISRKFQKTLADGKVIEMEVRESLLAGPGGFLKIESTWEILEDGTRRLTTIIPIGG